MKGASLVIISYNRCDELRKTLETLKLQVLDFPYEVIVVDQNSSDNTDYMMKNFQIENLIYHKLTKNLGVAGGRNVGAMLAKYDNLIFIDDDAHFLDNDGFKLAYQKMEECDAEMFAFKIYDKDGMLFHWPYGEKRKTLQNNSFNCSYYIGCGHGIKKSVFTKIGGYSDHMFYGFEETEFVMKAFGIGAKPVLYDGKIQVVHRVTQTARIPQKKMFYYKVRNRIFVIRECHPLGGGLYLLAYLTSYFRTAVRHNMLSEYRQGIKDAFSIIMDKQKRMSYKNFFRYLINL